MSDQILDLVSIAYKTKGISFSIQYNRCIVLKSIYVLKDWI